MDHEFLLKGKIMRRRAMENDVLKDIIDYATQKLTTAYGFCGVCLTLATRKVMISRSISN